MRFLLKSEWSAPVANGYGRALDFHLSRFARWLTTAGAEPRLALVLCSGRAARDRFVEGVDLDQIEVVHTPATAARPLHPRLLAHEGDHFNSTLYVVDGFEEADAGRLFADLNLRAGMLTRTATWTALVIESLETLEAFYRHAPRVAREVMRHCLVLDEHAAASPSAVVDADLRARWHHTARIAELIYADAMTPKAAPEAFDFDRLVRSGYLPALAGRAMHPERQRMAAVWIDQGASTLPFPVDQAGPASAEAAARRLSKLDDGTRAGLADRLTLAVRARLVADLSVGDAPVLAALQHVGAMARGEATPAPGAIARLRKVTTDADDPLRAHAAQAMAGAWAALGDVERCEAALADAAKHAHAAGLWELVFDVLERQVQIHTLLDRRGPARSTLDRLEALAPTLYAPFYAARRCLARGEFILPLDPSRGRLELLEAERLFTAHGYARWAEMAQEIGR